MKSDALEMSPRELGLMDFCCIFGAGVPLLGLALSFVRVRLLRDSTAAVTLSARRFAKT